MSGLLSASLRKSLADVTRRKARTLMVVLGIFIAVFGLTGINMTEDTLVNAFAFTSGYQASQPDIVMTVDWLDSALLPALSAVPNVHAVQYATRFASQWHLTSAPASASTPGPAAPGTTIPLAILSFPDLQHVAVDPFQLASGRYPAVGEVVMESGDAALHSVALGDLVTVDTPTGTAQLRVVGLARTLGANPAASGDALAYMSDAGLRQLVGANPPPPSAGKPSPLARVITVKVEQPSHETTTADALRQALQADGVTILSVGFPQAGPDPGTLRAITGVFTLLLTLAVVAMLLSGLLILNTITSLVAEQTAVIGTLKAIGGSRAAIMRGYLVTVVLYALLATPPALLLGIYAGYRLASLLAVRVPVEVPPFSVAPWVIALSMVVGFGVPLLAALPPLWNGTRITVREALSAYGVSLGRTNGLLAGFGARLTWVSQTTWLGVRGVFRRRWRAALTLLTLTIAGTSFLVVQTATTSVNDTVGAEHAHLSSDMTVYLTDGKAADRITAQLRALPGVAHVERAIDTNVITLWGTMEVLGVEPETQVYHPQLTSGRWLRPGDANVVLLSDDVARKSGLKIGDTMTVRDNGSSKTQLTLTVIGTLDQTTTVLGWIGAAVMPVDAVYTLRGIAPGQAASTTQELDIQARDRSQSAVDQLARQVAAVVNPAGFSGSHDGPGYYNGAGGTVDTTHEYVTRRQGTWYILYAMLYAIALIVAAVGALSLANALVASVLDRRRETGMLRALGASGRQVAHVFRVEGLVLGVIAWCAGALCGLPLAYVFVQLLWQVVMPVHFYVAPLAFGVMLAAMLGIGAVASLAPSWRAARMRTAELLRYE